MTYHLIFFGRHYIRYKGEGDLEWQTTQQYASNKNWQKVSPQNGACIECGNGRWRQISGILAGEMTGRAFEHCMPHVRPGEDHLELVVPPGPSPEGAVGTSPSHGNPVSAACLTRV